MSQNLHTLSIAILLPAAASQLLCHTLPESDGFLNGMKHRGGGGVTAPLPRWVISAVCCKSAVPRRGFLRTHGHRAPSWLPARGKGHKPRIRQGPKDRGGFQLAGVAHAGACRLQMSIFISHGVTHSWSRPGASAWCEKRKSKRISYWILRLHEMCVRNTQFNSN